MNKQIIVKMNKTTKKVLENNAKKNQKVRNELYDFAIEEYNEKGIAIFEFDDTEDDKVILESEYNSKTIKI